jgi:hypothetical protein
MIEHLHVLEVDGGKRKAFIHVVDCGAYVATACRLWPEDDVLRWPLGLAHQYWLWMHELIEGVAKGREVRFYDYVIGGKS